MQRFEILNHGYCAADYFQGCGTAYTDFSDCVTGAGMTAAEAYRDATDQIWQSELTDFEVKALGLPKRPRGYGITERNAVPADCRGEDSNVYWYVSIRFGKRVS